MSEVGGRPEETGPIARYCWRPACGIRPMLRRGRHPRRARRPRPNRCSPDVQKTDKLSAFETANASCSMITGLFGGRTRARTWDPMIKRHAVHIDFFERIFQPRHSPDIIDQWLTAKNPTMRARQRLADRCIRGVIGGQRNSRGRIVIVRPRAAARSIAAPNSLEVGVE